MKAPTHIIITGASSGLGKALALHYAKQGVRLSLIGRNAERLAEVSAACSSRGAAVQSAALNVCNQEQMAAWIAGVDAEHPVDLVIANAGISAGTGGQTEPDAQVRQIFAVNVDGVLNTIHPLIAPMTARKHGQIAIISSIAGMRGLPSSPAYSASKAAVRFYGEGLRGVLDKYGVSVSVVCPGYIKTPMTDVNDFPMPFMISAEKAARLIATGLAKKRSRIAFPKRLYIPLWFLSCLSPTLTDRFFATLPAKGKF